MIYFKEPQPPRIIRIHWVSLYLTTATGSLKHYETHPHEFEKGELVLLTLEGDRWRVSAPSEAEA